MGNRYDCNPELFEIKDGVLTSFKERNKRKKRVVVPPEVKVIGRWAFAGSKFDEIIFLGDVEAIEEEAFSHCDLLRSALLPDSLKSIGKMAFFGCERLKSASIPGGVKSIEPETFAECVSLKDVEISEGVESIGDSAFFSAAFETIEIPGSVKYISSSAFESAENLSEIIVDEANDAYKSEDGDLYSRDGKTIVKCAKPDASSIVISDGVTTIGEYAFCGLRALVSVKIPSGVTSICDNAFAYCFELENADIPSSVTSIGKWAFAYCMSLQNATIPDDTTYIGRSAFLECHGLESVIVPGGVKAIEPETFAGCVSLKEVRLSDGVESIGDNAFREMTLERIELPQSLKYISPKAFDAGSPAKIELDEKSASYMLIDGDLYSRDGKTLVRRARHPGEKTFVVSAAVSTVGSRAAAASEFEKLIFAGNVETLEEGAFMYCANISDIALPDVLKTVGGKAFYRCYKLESVELSDGVESLGDAAFGFCSLRKIYIPQNVKHISPTAFVYAENLTEIDVDEKNAAYKIVNGDLYSRDGKTLVKCMARNQKIFSVPNGVSSIGECAFEGCFSLEAIKIPSSVTSIGKGAFEAKWFDERISTEKMASLESVEFEDPYDWCYVTENGDFVDVDPEILKRPENACAFMISAWINLGDNTAVSDARSRGSLGIEKRR